MTEIDTVRRPILMGVIAFSLFFPAQGRTEEEAEPTPPASPSLVLVRMTDYEGLTTYKSSTPEEFRELAAAAKNDNEVLAKAYDNLRDEWKKTKTKVEKRTVTQGGKARQIEVKLPAPPFPLSKCPAPREVRQAGLYTTAEELEKAKAPLEESEKNRRERTSREKESKAAAADSKFIPMGNGAPDMGGLKGAVPITTTKQAKQAKTNKREKPTSSVSEEDILKNLIKEIERLTIENETKGGGGGLRGADLSKRTLDGTGRKTGAKGKSKAAPKIKRIGE
jgi:hypothetical protein